MPCEKCQPYVRAGVPPGIVIVDGEGAGGDLPLGIVERCDACQAYSSDLAALNETRRRAGLANYVHDPTALVGVTPATPCTQTFEVGLALQVAITADGHRTIPTLADLRNALSSAFLRKLEELFEAQEDLGEHCLHDRLLILSSQPTANAPPPRPRARRPQMPRERTVALLAPDDLPMPFHEFGGKNWCALASPSGHDIGDRQFLKRGRGHNSYLLPESVGPGQILELHAEPAGADTTTPGPIADRFRYRYYFAIRERDQRRIVLAQAATRFGVIDLANTILRIRVRERAQNEATTAPRRRRLIDLDA